MIVRINKYLSTTDIGSRRRIEQLLKKGEIVINGVITKPGILIDTTKDHVFYQNKEVFPIKEKVYLAFNKPINVLSTTSDTRGRKTIMDFIDIKERIYPIGRLDYNSTGLILLTNDGDLALKLTHPRYHLPKKYIVKVKEKINSIFLDRMSKADMKIENKKLIPTLTKKINEYTFEITLYQGIKRQIRLMCKSLGYNVVFLQRVQVGSIFLDNLRSGEYRILSDREIKQLYEQISMVK